MPYLTWYPRIIVIFAPDGNCYVIDVIEVWGPERFNIITFFIAGDDKGPYDPPIWINVLEAEKYLKGHPGEKLYIHNSIKTTPPKSLVKFLTGEMSRKIGSNIGPIFICR